MPNKKGGAPLTHLVAVEKQTGKAPPELVTYYELECPDELFNYWNDFLEISKRRQTTESGPNPISFEEIHSWQCLYNETVTPLQIDVICWLDNVWLTVWMEKNKK